MPSASSGAMIAGPVYLDASALVKLYLAEAESRELERLLLGREDLIVSELGITEVISAASRRRREGSLDRKAVARLQQALLRDVANRAYLRALTSVATHRAAERLLMVSDVHLRAGDALHLALAIQEGARTMITYDPRLSAAAPAASLVALDPSPKSR